MTACRVSLDENKHDRDTSFRSDAEEIAYDQAREQAITDKVNEIMGGSDKALLTDCIINDDDVMEALLGLSTIDCSRSIDKMTAAQSRQLQSYAHEVNEKIALKLRKWVDNE